MAMVRLLSVMGVSAISFTGIFVRLAGVSPTTAAFFRCALAVPFLYVMVWYWDSTNRTRWLRFLSLVSGALFALDLILYHHTIQFIGAGLATVLGNTQVIFVGIAAWIIHRERPTGLAMALVPLIFTGVVLVSGLGRAEAYGSQPVLGVVAGIATALAYSGFLMVFRASNPDGVPTSGPLLDCSLATALCTLVFGLIMEPHFTMQPSWPAFGWLFLLAVGSQVFGWLLIGYALPRLPALETSILLLLQPLLTVVWGYIIFSEHLSALQWTGCVFILGGMALLHFRGSIAQPDEASPE